MRLKHALMEVCVLKGKSKGSMDMFKHQNWQNLGFFIVIIIFSS